MKERAMLRLKIGEKDNRRRQIDQLVGEVIKAYGVSSRSTALVTTPYLQERIRARIEAEQIRRAAEGQAWRQLFIEGLYVIPVLGLVAILVMGMAFADYSSLRREGNRVMTTTPALAWSDIAPFSNDELMAATIESDEVRK